MKSFEIIGGGNDDAVGDPNQSDPSVGVGNLVFSYSNKGGVGREGLLGRLKLVMGYYNFCLPHLSLREALPKPIPTKGNGSPKKWTSRTPAMAAGITDHVWSVGEFLLFRVPPRRQEVTAA